MPRVASSKSSKFFKKISNTPIFGVIIGGLISLAASYIATSKQFDNQEKILNKQFSIQWEMQVLNKRIELIDRATKVFMQKAGFRTENPKATDFSNKLTALYTEYASVIMGAKMYFGPKTHLLTAEFRDLDAPIEIDAKVQSSLIESMHEELYYGFHYTQPNYQ